MLYCHCSSCSLSRNLSAVLSSVNMPQQASWHNPGSWWSHASQYLSLLLANLNTHIFLSVLIGLAQVLELVNAVPYEPPSAAEEEAFLAEPCHILARLYRDLFKDEETAKATLAVCAHCIPFVTPFCSQGILIPGTSGVSKGSDHAECCISRAPLSLACACACM